MFKDRDEALRQMSQALLEEEEEPQALFDDYEEDYEEDLLAPAGDLDAYNGDPMEQDLERYSQDLYQPQKRNSLTALALTCMGLMAAILAVLVYWVVKFRG